MLSGWLGASGALGTDAVAQAARMKTTAKAKRLTTSSRAVPAAPAAAPPSRPSAAGKRSDIQRRMASSRIIPQPKRRKRLRKGYRSDCVGWRLLRPGRLRRTRRQQFMLLARPVGTPADFLVRHAQSTGGWIVLGNDIGLEGVARVRPHQVREGRAGGVV